MYNVVTFESLLPLAIRTNSNARSLGFYLAATRVAIANSQENRVILSDLHSGRHLGLLPHPGSPEGAETTPDEKFVAVWNWRAVRVWRLNGTDEKEIVASHGVGVPGAAYSRDGKWLASVLKEGTVEIRDVGDGRLIRTLRLGRLGQGVSLSPDRRLVATADYAEVWLWDTGSWKHRKVENDCGPTLWSIAFSPDGRHLAAAGSGGVNVWRVDSGADGFEEVRLELLPSPRLANDPRSLKFNSRHVTFSPNGRLFGWSDQDGVHIWDLETGRQRPSPTSRPFNPIQNLSFLPDSRRVVFVTTERWAEVWDTETGESLQRFDVVGPGDRSSGTYACKVQLSPDGRWLAVSSITGMGINIWDLEAEKLSLALPEEAGAIWRLAWAPDSVRLTAASGAGDIVTWDLDEVRRRLEELGLDW